ncbi:MAG: Zn-ribbon domain-containing OB-fold protein [Janthinobacterium lividum]
MSTEKYDYLGMSLLLNPDDKINREYFAHCAAHDFRLQACGGCGLLRYPPGPGCPWCGSSDYAWKQVEGRGTVYSYYEVAHAIQPGFKPHLPYLVLLVELDTQRGTPTEHEGLRILANLVKPDGSLASAEELAKVGIGSRVKMVFTDLGAGMALPQWTLDQAVDQPAAWRFPE